MAFSVSNLFQVLGKYIKSVNIYDGDFTDLETYKTDIRTVMQSQGYLDNYARMPTLTVGYQNNLASYIQALIAESKKPFLDEAKVFDQLRLSAFTFNDVMDGIYDYFTDNADTVLESVTSIGGSDVDLTDVDISATGGGTPDSDGPKIFVTRDLDGTNAPSDLVPSNQRYNNIESSLSESTTLYFECTSSGTAGSEQVLIYPESPVNAPYTHGDAEPKQGPTLINVHGSSLVPNNWDMTTWTADTPDNWTMAGGVETTDWADDSGTGAGPLKLITLNTSATQLITGMSHETMYMIAVFWASRGTAATNNELTMTLQDSSAASIFTSATSQIVHATDYAYTYDFYSLPTSVDLTDVNLQLKYTAEGNAANSILIRRVMVAPVTYYNGLGFVFWNGGSGLSGSPGINDVVLADYGSMAVANNDAGVFQTYIRKAFQYQLPQDATPTVTETWAT